MENLTNEEKRFFEMIKSKSAKKISLNFSIETISKIDELTEILKVTRTLLIESIILVGLKTYLETIESANKKVKAQKEYKNNKKLDEMFINLSEFKKKWKI